MTPFHATRSLSMMKRAFLSASSASSRLLCVAVTLTLGACANLAPPAHRPAPPVPTQWTSSTAGTVPADSGWRDFVSDDRLRQVMLLTLAQNRDLRVAAANLEQARALYRVQDAARLPGIDAGIGASRSHTAADLSSTTDSRSVSVSLGLSAYELDFFGRLKNLSESALQRYLSSEQAQRTTQLGLIAEVANAWLTLGADRARLALAQATLESQQRTYELSQRRQALGAVSGLSLAQQQTAVESARVDVAAFRTQIAQDLNALNLLAGQTVPEALLPTPQTNATSATALVAVPADLPSTVLQRRPDVIAAEHDLLGANADIGAARAALFPSVSLTAAAGTASTGLQGLFKAGNGIWSIAPSIDLALFDGGARRASVAAAEAAQRAQLASYERTLQTAFREVADALAVRDQLGERLAAQQALLDATRRARDLADARYQRGLDSYLAVLDAQRTAYAAEQSWITLQLTEQSNRIALFKTLGGGWH